MEMSRFTLLAVLAILPALATAGRISYVKCLNGGPLPAWVEVEGCDEFSCRVPNNVYTSFGFELTTEDAADKLKVTIVADFMGQELPLELPEELQDGCRALENGCPVEAGKTFEISGALPLFAPTELEGLELFLEMAVENENNDRIMCVRSAITVIP